MTAARTNESARLHGIIYADRQSQKRPFQTSVTAAAQRLYRGIIERLPTGEWRVLRVHLNRWFRCQGKTPIALGFERIGELTGYTVRHVKRLVGVLLDKGFLVSAGGGQGRGSRRHFAVDLTAILRALAPDIYAREKGTFEPGAYRSKGEEEGSAAAGGVSIARKWQWLAGAWGRSARFRERLALALRSDSRARWREYLTASTTTDSQYLLEART